MKFENKKRYSFQGRKIFPSGKFSSASRPKLLPLAKDQAFGLNEALYGISFSCLKRDLSRRFETRDTRYESLAKGVTMSDKKVLDFIAETGMLKRVKRSGWWMLGVPYEESVAEHSFRCAVIGYILAKQENADVSKVLLMTLFNDLHEARINDMHKVAQRYINAKKAEKEAFLEQIEPLEKKIKDEMTSFHTDYNAQKTKESLIARDADILECLIQAKEYFDLGFTPAKKFFKKAPELLKTKSAKKLWNQTKKWDSSTWWEKLGDFKR